MTYEPYTYLAMLPTDCEVSIPRLAEDMRDLFQKEKRATYVHATDEGLILQIEEWSLRVNYNHLSYVKEESKEIAGCLPGDQDQLDRLAGCRHRIETSADPDPNMDYFNYVIDVLELVDKHYPSFIIDSQVGEMVKPA
jgi:hypothetical protein